MSKFGVGVGEDFPVDEPPSPRPESEEERAQRLRHRRHHHMLHIATRIAFLALIVAFIVWMFVPHPYTAGPAGYGPYGYGFHRHVFFPFFPLLLIFVLAMAWRRRCYGPYRHWHEHRHYDRREEG
jgi:hypothetical protein